MAVRERPSRVPLRSRLRGLVSGLLVGLGAAGGVAVWRAADLPFSRRLVELELALYDDRADLRGRVVSARRDSPVAVVAIDETSIGSLKDQGLPYPWPRSIHAQLVRQLKRSGARVIAFDVNFDTTAPEPGQKPDPSDLFWEARPCAADLEFARAIREAGNVVLAAVVEEAVVQVEGHEEVTATGAFPAAIFDDAAAAHADARVPIDIDGTVRRAKLATRFQDERLPSFPVAVVAAYREAGPGLGERALRLADDWASRHAEAMAPDGAFWVDYAPADTVPPPTPTVPYVVALAGEQSDAFRDRIVLIGATAPDLQDLYDAPARRVLARGATQERIPGVAVHANAICTLLAERPLRPAAPWLTWLSTLLLGALTGVATFAARPVRALWAYVLPATVVAGGGAFTVFAYGDLWVNLALPLSGGIGLAYVGATVLAYLTVERDRKRIEAEWAKRVSPEVLTRLLADPGLRHVEGRTIQATILFSDLRGFTTLCHSLPPTDVVRRLNEIFDRMTRVIKAHGGTIDKFIGDGIMAVFGDPIPYPDHARRAVEAAIDMLRANEELRDAATERGEEPIRMGVGMHSGEIVIGDIGSELFLEYTAIGDTVSTASRLEGLNKEYHTEIICSDDTLRLAGEGLATRPLGATTVRGRETPLQVHEVLWAKNLAQ